MFRKDDRPLDVANAYASCTQDFGFPSPLKLRKTGKSGYPKIIFIFYTFIMIINHKDLNNLSNFNPKKTPFDYVFPIPAGRNDEENLNKVSDLLINDGLKVMISDYASKIIFMGSHWESLHLKHQFIMSGAKLRKKRFKELNQKYIKRNENIDIISDDRMIIFPRGLETINKFIALRKIIQNSKIKSNKILILSPDLYFGKRIDYICKVFLDNGKLGKHIVAVMNHEKELDDMNRKEREKRLLNKTKEFFKNMKWINNPRLKDELTKTIEEELVMTKPYQLFFKDCREIIKMYPPTGKESPYKGLDK